MTPPEAAIRSTREALGARGLRPAIAGHDIWIASGLERALPETALLCVQRSDAVDVLRARGVTVFCLAEHADPATLAAASSADLFAHPATARFCAEEGPLGVICFKPNARLERAVTAAGAMLLAGDTPAARAFENKLAFVDIARRAGLRTPEWAVVDAAAYTDLARRFGPRLVVQGARGNAGQRTYLVEDEPAMATVRHAERDGRLRVAAYVDGLPFTATGIAAAGGLADWIEPCRQLTGIDWLTPMPLGSCGNAWGAASIRPHHDEVHRILATLAGELSAAGYDGLFGVDFVLGPDGPVVIETNPRLVASIPFATQMELEAGRPSLLLRHLALAAGATLPASPAPTGSIPEASQVIIHRLEGEPPLGSSLPSGVYRLEAGTPPVRLRDGVWLADLEQPGEVLLLARAAEQPVTPRRELARVYLRSSLAERHPGLQELVAAVRGLPGTTGR